MPNKQTARNTATKVTLGFIHPSAGQHVYSFLIASTVVFHGLPTLNENGGFTSERMMSLAVNLSNHKVC